MAGDPNITHRKHRLGFPEIKDIEAVLTGEFAVRGCWLLANVQTGSLWPVTAQKVAYRGEEMWILTYHEWVFSISGDEGADR
jgi:hypothetical protein